MTPPLTYRDLPEVEVLAVCHDCRKRHLYRELPAHLGEATQQWVTKHYGHRIAFGQLIPSYSRWLLRQISDFWCSCPIWRPLGYEYGDNANVLLAYVASAAYTLTLGALATSSTRTAGRESTAVSNAGNKYLDYLIAGKITTGTTPTVSLSARL